ncbi:MAG: response regulator transcription factor [Alteromonadaceae bacterium]|nr:response regulator transcription factor [Alteromonadaceae bacterium]
MDNDPKQVFIADDEPLARDRLKRLIDQLPDHRVCGEAANGEEALAGVSQHQPDILLLDIHMPGLDGMAAARRLAELANPPALIFCTAHEQHALEAFGVNAAAYLLKPVRKEALAQALAQAGKTNRLQRQALNSPLPNEREQITVRSQRGTELIDLADILYCQADQKYVTLVHRHGETLCDYSLKELEQAYPARFLRIHRHTLAATAFIQALNRTPDGHHRLALKETNTRLPVSRRHVSQVRQWLEHR